MPIQTTETSGGSPFEIVTNKKSGKVGKKGLIIGSVVVLFLALSIIAGVLLVKQQQNISEKAAAVDLCPAAEACPVAGQVDVLKSCSQPNSDQTPRQISCSNISNVGVIASCGSNQFCCPSLGASWTTDISLCATPTPTPTATLSATPTATASATPTATATGSATPKVQTSPLPIPVSGTSWPTLVGAGVGVLVIIGSILLAL